MAHIKKVLEEIFTSKEGAPGAFSSAETLFNEARKSVPTLSRNDVKTYLQGKDSYTLHLEKKKVFQRRVNLVARPKIILVIDLVDFSKLKKFNQSYGYILVCLDLFSRYVFAKHLKGKDGISVASALNDILTEPEGRGYTRIFADRGKEFLNVHMAKVLADNGITIYHSSNTEVKASPVERYIRGFKSRLARAQTEFGTPSRFVDLYQGIVTSLNQTPHRGLKGLTPAYVHSVTDPAKLKIIFHRIYKNHDRKNKKASKPLAVGQAVRVSLSARITNPFHRGYNINNSREIFIVKKLVKFERNLITYKLARLDGDLIESDYYIGELLPVQIPDLFRAEIVDVNPKKSLSKVHIQEIPLKYVQWLDNSIVNKWLKSP